MNNEKFIGVDLHKKYLTVSVMDEGGDIKDQLNIDNDKEAIVHFFKQYPQSKVAVESTFNWYPFFDTVEPLVQEIHLANPARTKAIASAKIKTDKIDSSILAHLLRTDLLAESYIAPLEIRYWRETVRGRFALVKTQTYLKNLIHAILFKNGISHDFSDLFSAQGIAFLKDLPLAEPYQQNLDALLAILSETQKQIKKFSKIIQEKVKLDQSCQLLVTIPGIGSCAAALIKAEIGSIERFVSDDKLCSYAGLISSIHSSGGKTFYGHITKAGSRWLRWILVEAVQTLTKSNTALGRYYRRLNKRKGKNVAKVATARKLCSIIWHVLFRKEPYNDTKAAGKTNLAKAGYSSFGHTS